MDVPFGTSPLSTEHGDIDGTCFDAAQCACHVLVHHAPSMLTHAEWHLILAGGNPEAL